MIRKIADGKCDRRRQVRSSSHPNIDPKLSKSPLAAMAPTEEAQEKNSRGIPKAPFIVSYTDRQPWREIDGSGVHLPNNSQPSIPRQTAVGRREIHRWVGRRCRERVEKHPGRPRVRSALKPHLIASSSHLPFHPAESTDTWTPTLRRGGGG